ncbi:DDT domain-containing protein PTM-like [Andrographis paniculata]|uniref:DDT domain-containing protein PTM-like n=1 Tax=Andrographis paniculata TaxID=175694 RepID=UPI0021E79930|nr:DDT domain-containing protein PTM-like [Andrographis paniculata]
MEYIGRAVKKEVRGQDPLFGLVRGYEPGTGIFEVVYDGGSSEELGFLELSSVLVSGGCSSPPPLGSDDGGNPRKRRCIADEGKGSDNLVILGGVSDNSVVRDGKPANFDLNLNDDDGCNTLNDDRGFNSVEIGGEIGGLDLNKEVNLEVGEGPCLNNGVSGGVLGPKKQMIDLNVDVNEGFKNLGGGSGGICFDLNLKFVEDEGSTLAERGVGVELNEGVCGEERERAGADLAVADMESGKGNVEDLEKKEVSQPENSATEVSHGNVAPISAPKKRRGRKRKDSTNSSIETAPVSPDFPKSNTETDKMDVELESIKETPITNGNGADNGVLGTMTRVGRGRKRRAVQEGDVTLPTPETGLRRSSRRAKIAASSEPDLVPLQLGDGNNHQLSSPAISVVSDEKVMAPARRKAIDCAMDPPKVDLPPSSCDLDINGVSMLDVFSAYSFLRSFSTSLFLSPFGLDDFVISLKSSDSTLLFDSIHLSLLRTIRKHLESLSEEGSASASNCLRSLNWDFLDLITWPVFLVEYHLLHNPGHVPDIGACNLKLFYDDYYKLPVSAKVEILRHLCDDVLEAEVFRSELNRRMAATDQRAERSTKFDTLKRKKAAMDAASSSCITEEDAEDPLDWNSDECSLCKMDGNLICCDGCPAAFHSRCVGVVSSQLPEGEWFCPECSIEKDNPGLRVRKSARGAQCLGVDPCGRVYYSSCSYLLVLELCNDEYLSWTYNGNDVPYVIEALESSPLIYGTIINAICKHWNIVRGVNGARLDSDTRSSSLQSMLPGKGRVPPMCSVPSETHNENGAIAENRSVDELTVPINSCNTQPENAKSCAVVLETGDVGAKINNQLASSEGSAEVSQMFVQCDTLKESGPNCSKTCLEVSDQCLGQGTFANADQYMAPTSVNVEKGKNLSSESCGYAPDTAYSREVPAEVYNAVNYVNSYEFARTPSSFYEEWSCKATDKTSQDTSRSAGDIVARQLKVVSNRSAEFSWANIQTSKMNLRKERCGWCLYCRVPEEERDCLFIMNDSIPAVENYTNEVLGIQSAKKIKNHLVDVMCHIICIEDHLQGLLLGPWLNQEFSMLWRRSVLEAADLASLKNSLLMLEKNLHHLAIPADWQKQVDTVTTMGSACHIVSSSTRLSSKNGMGRKRENPSKVETSQSSNAATGLSLFWWRGGRGSRMLFNWKVLPHCLASMAGRQGGRKKIPGIIYPESGEYAKRTKCASWRAAVEASRSVHQLALQVRELDATLKWADIGNNNLILKTDKDTKKPVRSFKKVIIRRKSSDGGTIKYLLDFGKRRFIPDVVVKHGSIVEDPSSKKKKYWLEETHVPLHLLKSFEEKRIARKSNVVKSGKLRESIGVLKKPFKRKGFSYLFSRAERLENFQCGHCKKDVPISEAVSCQHCRGFFHRRHAQKSAGSIASECTYTCHKCQSANIVKIDGRKSKFESAKQKKSLSTQPKPLQQAKAKGKRKGKGKRTGKRLANKKTAKVQTGIPLRRSSRNAARVARHCLQSAIVKRRKRGRKAKSAKSPIKKPKINNWKRRRSPVACSFWLNGVRLSRRPNDARLVDFRSKMLLLLPGEANNHHDNPTCNLCAESEHNPELVYVACELCGVWFHGDAFNLTDDRIENIIGFKCPTCLKRTPPVCPHYFPTENKKADPARTKTDKLSDSDNAAKGKLSGSSGESQQRE